MRSKTSNAGHTGQRHGPVGGMRDESENLCGMRNTNILMAGYGTQILRRDVGCAMKDRKSYVTDVKR